MDQETWTAVDSYLCERLVENDPALDHALRESYATGLPNFVVAPNQGKLLQLRIEAKEAALDEARQQLEENNRSLMAGFQAEAERAGISAEEFRRREYEAGGKTVPIGRMGTPEDIADVAAFLVSKQSDYMTGQSLNVCGGLVMN